LGSKFKELKKATAGGAKAVTNKIRFKSKNASDKSL